MKAGLTLSQMAAEIQRRDAVKQDYLVNTGNLTLEPEGKDLYLHVRENGIEQVEPFGVSTLAHRQIGDHLKIPAKYYERMLSEKPELLAANVNTWLAKDTGARMLRTLEGTARAFLSNRYRCIDNLDIAQVVLPIISEMEDARVESCHLTETRMYIKVVNPRLQKEVTPGDIVQSGIIISNSEVGLGAVNIQPLIYRLVCSNGMVVNDAQARKHHVGRAMDTEESYSLYSEKTLAADDQAFVMKIQDTVRAAVDETRFSRVVAIMREAKDAKMNTKDIPSIVQLTGKEFRLSENEGKGILQYLVEGNDLSLYGLSNAVTRYSQDVKSYDRATELEGVGYSILTMPGALWKRLNTV